MNVFTIGYEGSTLEGLVYALKSNFIQTLIDVRFIPLSRKPGFSKDELCAAVEAAGMKYRHFKALGCPSVVRDVYREDGNWESYSRKFKQHLAAQAAAVDELYDLVTTSNSCLLCYERDVRRCHRRYVADRLVELSEGRLRRVDLRPCLENDDRNQAQASLAFF